MKRRLMTSIWIGTLAMGLGLVVNAPLTAAETTTALDESPVAVKYVPHFTEFHPRRPVVMTHAGDDSDRLFVVSQQGVIHIAPTDLDAEEGQTFLDIESQVVYADSKNEEGLLGLAFHPKYRDNGQFFVYYTRDPSTSVISRFRVSETDPNKADPDSEEELLTIEQPFWNHNGGTLAFGPDGFLYVGLGDGGAANDPMMNGQNIQTLLGSILRIDVDHKDQGLNYAIPKSNPFTGNPRLARGEIFAFGLRNVWRMSFDRDTGQFWAADVGQDLWEEINLIESGGNYGWDLREARHKFGPVGSAERPDLIDPIFEYHHDIGKSITGGYVYRGTKVPALKGHYIYGDYVSGKLWALKYDRDLGRVTANRPIRGENVPVMTFGEDEQGEIYFSDPAGRIFRFESID